MAHVNYCDAPPLAGSSKPTTGRPVRSARSHFRQAALRGKVKEEYTDTNWPCVDFFLDIIKLD